MSTQFEFRALDDDAYAVVVELLNRVVGGETEALTLLVERTRVAAQASELRRLNAASSIFRLADDTLAALITPNATTARALAQLAVPCSCLRGASSRINVRRRSLANVPRSRSESSNFRRLAGKMMSSSGSGEFRSFAPDIAASAVVADKKITDPSITHQISG